MSASILVFTAFNCLSNLTHIRPLSLTGVNPCPDFEVSNIKQLTFIYYNYTKILYVMLCRTEEYFNKVLFLFK